VEGKGGRLRCVQSWGSRGSAGDLLPISKRLVYKRKKDGLRRHPWKKKNRESYEGEKSLLVTQTGGPCVKKGNNWGRRGRTFSRRNLYCSPRNLLEEKE